MSVTSQGPGWWLASDDRWYPPQVGYVPPAPPPPYDSTPWASPVQDSGYGMNPVSKRNGFAVTSMVLGICAFFPFFGLLVAVAALIFGFIARRQIQLRGGSGRGQALAGIILGSIVTVFYLFLFTVLITAHVTNCRHGFNC